MYGVAENITNSEVHLESSGASTMELFWQNSQKLLAVNCFRNKAPSRRCSKYGSDIFHHR